MSEHSEALEPVAFGKYLLDEELARGGMSRVFRARLRGPGGFEKRLVVKQILPELAADPEFIKLFVKEANTLVQLSHPNLVPVFELGVVDDVYFLAMEWVQGATVDELLRQGPLPAALVAQIGAQIADALHYAHERFSIVHRDVTPRNVIVDATGYARLLDFGIAARVEHTGSGELFGSPGYMAPEQLRGEGLSPASDLFSLGCVLYEAISGKPAWPPLRSASELDANPAPAPLELADEHEPLRELITGLIERDPKARPQPAGHVAERLRAWLSEHHPRGLLSDLAERVSASRAHSADKPREAQEPPRVSSGRIEVRSIAVSPELTALLGQATEKIARLPIAPAADSGDDQKPSSAPDTMAADPELHRLARRLLRDAVVITFALFVALLWPKKDDDEEEVAKKGRTRTPATSVAAPAAEPIAPSNGSAAESGNIAEANVAPPVLPPTAAADDIPAIPSAPGAAQLAPQPTAAVETAPSSNAPGATQQPPAATKPTPGASGPLQPTQPSAADKTAPTTPGEQTPQPAAADKTAPSSNVQGATQPPPASDKTAPVPTAPGPQAPQPSAASDKPEDDSDAAQKRGFLSVSAVPWAEVRVDGRLLGATPRRSVPLRAGKHSVNLSCPPLAHETTLTVDLQPEQELRVTANMHESPPEVTAQ